MREALGYMVKSVSDHKHKELLPDEIYQIFKTNFVDITEPLKITKTSYDRSCGIEATVSLEDINWISETEPECPVTATWTGESGDWYVDIVYKENDLGRLFIQATYYEGGESYIKSSVPQQINNIYLGDKSYRISIKEINGVKVLGVD
jgi:hypothetical protein